jgi:hypothetical protein
MTWQSLDCCEPGITTSLRSSIRDDRLQKNEFSLYLSYQKLIKKGPFKVDKDKFGKSSFDIHISGRLVDIIELHAEDITKALIEDVRQHSSTPTYHTYDEQELFNRAFRVYSHLGEWISREKSKEEIADHYKALGSQRREEGFSLSEVIQALIMARRHIWLKIMSEGFMDTALDMNKAMDLNNRVVLFFDRAIYYTSLGYEQKE